MFAHRHHSPSASWDRWASGKNTRMCCLLRCNVSVSLSSFSQSTLLLSANMSECVANLWNFRKSAGFFGKSLPFWSGRFLCNAFSMVDTQWYFYILHEILFRFMVFSMIGGMFRWPAGASEKEIKQHFEQISQILVPIFGKSEVETGACHPFCDRVLGNQA